MIKLNIKCILVRNVGVIDHYLPCNIFCQMNRYSKIAIKNVDNKILCKCLCRIFLKVFTLIWTKKDQEKALDNGNMAVEILLLRIVFC